MIQRIQSVWLLLAAIVGAGLFYFSLYKYDVIQEGVEITKKLSASNNFILLLLTLIVIALPLVTIFLFKNRKSQKKMAVLSIVGQVAFIAVTLMLIGNINNEVPPPTDAGYMPGIIIPVISIVFIVMAIRGINKDEKLIRSQDRLR